MKTVRLLVAVLALAGCAAAPPARGPFDAVDAEARRLMAREGVEGLALAVIENGEVVHVAAYGRRNVERDLPLTTDTIMYGASLTKTAFAYLVMQLVDEGRLDLDASVADLLPRPLPEYEDYADLAGDDRWRALTPRILLTHTSGFANFRWLEADQRLRFHWDPGTRYGYSGEGFYILQLILEEGLGLDVGQEMQTRVFDRFGMTRTSMSWRPDFAANLADGYGLDGTMEPHDERSSVSAAGSMDTSIADQARLWAGIMRGRRAQRGVARGDDAGASADHVVPSVPDAAGRDRAAQRRDRAGGGARAGDVPERDRAGVVQGRPQRLDREPGDRPRARAALRRPAGQRRARGADLSGAGAGGARRDQDAVGVGIRLVAGTLSA